MALCRHIPIPLPIVEAGLICSILIPWVHPRPLSPLHQWSPPGGSEVGRGSTERQSKHWQQRKRRLLRILFLRRKEKALLRIRVPRGSLNSCLLLVVPALTAIVVLSSYFGAAGLLRNSLHFLLFLAIPTPLSHTCRLKKKKKNFCSSFCTPHCFGARILIFYGLIVNLVHL